MFQSLANSVQDHHRNHPRYLSISCIIATQAADLRAKELKGCYDASEILSPKTQRLYQAMKSVLNRQPCHDVPLVWNDDQQCLSDWIAAITLDLSDNQSKILAALPQESRFLNE